MSVGYLNAKYTDTDQKMRTIALRPLSKNRAKSLNSSKSLIVDIFDIMEPFGIAETQLQSK